VAGASSGLGFLIRQDNAQLETARLFAEVVVLAVDGDRAFRPLAVAERRVVTWR